MSKMSCHLVVTIDGPAGTGKSTVARQLASRLQVHFLDTGAMYRAVAYHSLQSQAVESELAQIVEIAKGLQFELDGHSLLINGKEPGDSLRTSEVTSQASRLAAYVEVREVLVEQQQKIGQSCSLVTEGRDQGTVVFPQATCKFFLTANPEIRARRRFLDLSKSANPPSFEEVLQAQLERDKRDESRQASPLKAAEDAIQIDTSDLSRNQVIDLLEQHVRQAASTLQQQIDCH